MGEKHGKLVTLGPLFLNRKKNKNTPLWPKFFFSSSFPLMLYRRHCSTSPNLFFFSEFSFYSSLSKLFLFLFFSPIQRPDSPLIVHLTKMMIFFKGECVCVQYPELCVQSKFSPPFSLKLKKIK
jgi:hypothetical protein